MFNSKILIVIIVLLAILIILYFTGKKSVHHEITINANPEKVWTVLTNTNDYDMWNPVMKLLEGEIKEGNKVKYQFTQDTNTISQIPSTVKKIIPKELLNQAGGMPLILTFDHKYILESSLEGTKLIIHEDYRGIGVNFWNPKPVEEAYTRLNKAIKQRVESLY
ncbi:SRPBCC domain-containing protein [Aquimarina litoralis]|uniref:SRPBCC domain-containing protein n=1 Tax=Aquimarina litoralis TaxID=584605 RepID=UPI001C5964FF|nr:SRPBCC domain-containing protein [Aquimarina litoralis]MBW1294430.1 SRPBCC domain-containing protein [Aquimarina litoralis]